MAHIDISLKMLSISREAQTKATVRHYFMPAGTASARRQTLTNIGKDVKKLQFSCIEWWGHFRKVWQFLKMLKVELPYDPAIPPEGIQPRKLKPCSQKNFHTVFTAALFFFSIIFNTVLYLF